MIRVRIRKINGDTIIIAYGKPDEDFGEQLAENEQMVDVEIDDAPENFHLHYTFNGDKFILRDKPLSQVEYENKRYGEDRLTILERRLAMVERMVK